MTVEFIVCTLAILSVIIGGGVTWKALALAAAAKRSLSHNYSIVRHDGWEWEQLTQSLTLMVVGNSFFAIAASLLLMSWRFK